MIYDERYNVIEIFHFSGSKKMNGTLDAAAAADAGGGLTDITITAHGLVAGDWIRIAGSVAYDGVWRVYSAPDANSIYIEKAYTAEIFAGTETYAVALKPDCDFELLETRLKLSVASAAENYIHLFDANAGATWDATLETTAMNGLTEKVIVWRDATKRRFMEKGDVLYWTYANTNNATWGLTVIIRRQA